MPGLSQLKKFSEDVANLGNELTIREERGEPIVQVPFPTNISEEDDSNDFVLGMPLQSEDDDIDGDSIEELDSTSDVGVPPPSSPSEEVDYSAFPELDSLLNPEPVDSMDFSDFPELDAILNPQGADPVTTIEPVTEEVEDLGDLPDFDVETTDDSNEVELGDSFGEGLDVSFNDSFQDTLSPLEAPPIMDETTDAVASDDDFSLSDLPEFSSDLPNVSIESDDDFSQNQDVELSFDGKPEEIADFADLPPLDTDSFSMEESPLSSPDSYFDPFSESEDKDSKELNIQKLNLPDFDLPDTDFSSDMVLGDENSSLGSDSLDSLEDVDSNVSTDSETPSETEGFELPDFDSPSNEASSDGGGFDLPDFDNPSTESLDVVDDFGASPTEDSVGDFATDSSVQEEAPLQDTGFDSSSAQDSSSIGTEDLDTESHPAIDFGSNGPTSVDHDFASIPINDEEYSQGLNGIDEAGEDGVDSFVPEHHEVFDAPDDPFEGVEPPPDENFDDFDIPGFSDQAAGVALAKPKRINIASKDGKREKNTLTDKEYETFLKNLKGYPLNVRIELQKLVVGDEFKDEVVFDLVQKVVKKTSARQLATQLEKLLDISIPVPREFEKRTAAEYEEYKKSAEYQLKNRILPIALISVMAACILFVIFLFGKNFVYEPLRANALYKEGYALLEEGAYPQSEMKFDEALTYQQQKRWFFTYADGYRKHKQYERARTMYKAGLQRFNQDKELGLDYAEMELYDLRNFEKAETVVRREVLDYHINDPDGMLLLGDIYLEWGDERDPSKYEAAREVYDDILQLYGQEDLYLARMMRYYIRVDDLRNVLQMKEYFYPKEKSLGGQDLIELSGYLLDKISGNIKPTDEYLLSSIEDVRELLERAVDVASDVPESLYNMGLYFMNANNSTSARDWLSAALTSFENAEYKPRKRLLRQLNTYRLLGDLDMENKEYLSAEQKYRTGISLFEKAADAGLVGDGNVGKLYASLGDINYLITGDFDEALQNYSVAVSTEYDVPSIHYKMGYINYSKKEYGEALNLFIKTAESMPTDTHVLLALGNVLSSRGDNFAAQGYYQRLMDILDQQMVRYGILFPNDNDEHKDFISMYNRAANNLGVTLSRLARQTGNSAMNAEALTNFTASLRAWDSLTRDPDTLVRREGSNLAEQNIKYMSMPIPDYEPSIYTEIPVQLEGEFIPK